MDFPNPRRAEKAAATLPATGAQTLFTITGGRIVVVQILGEVTTAIQAQANATKLRHNVTTGTDQDLCATLDITGDELGTLYGITGLFSDAMIGSGQAVPRMLRQIILKPGTIELVTAATNTGATKWSLFYRQLDRAASVA
jgi:hypothetical protein